MPCFAALLKISGKVKGAHQRPQNFSRNPSIGETKNAVSGKGGHDVILLFDAPSVQESTDHIDTHTHYYDPLTIIKTTVTGETTLSKA